jgi:hypothetical protein
VKLEVDPDQAPRRDGLIEAKGTWGDVTVGSVLASGKRTEIWDVVDSKQPDQHEYAHTHWFKIRERSSGAIHAVKPKMVNAKVTFLLTAPNEVPPARTPSPDGEDIEAKMRLLVAELGAVEIYTRDSATGEITCPANHYDVLDHMRVAHDIDTTALEAIESSDERIAQMFTIHGRAHSPKHPAVGKGGFAHRHVPEEHDII